ncbi:MAG: ricin-type beta-trefoil lectin domain protein [Streptosporangiaceae bacterium]
MLRRPMLARLGIAAAALVGAVGTVAVTAPAQAATQSARTALPGARIVSHRGYAAALAAVRRAGHHRIAGIEYARGKAPKALGAAGTTCTEPNCDLTYHGGPVQTSPHIYLVFWGPNWQSNSAQKASAKYLTNFYKGLGVTPQDSWSTITSQYVAGNTHPSFDGSVYMGNYYDSTVPPKGVTQAQLAAEAVTMAKNARVTDQVNAQMVIVTPPGTCPQGFYAPNCYGGSGNYCAWHANTGVAGTNVTYTNLPYLPEAGAGCGQNFVNGANGTNDGWSIIGGHEYAETITDPYPPQPAAKNQPYQRGGYVDLKDFVSGGEIGDKCAWGGQLWGSLDPSGNVKLSTGTFAMQSLWSNATHSCVLTTSKYLDKVEVRSPGRQVAYLTNRVRLQMPGTSFVGSPLTWRATNLPKGLWINSSTGYITGIPRVTGGYQVTVRVHDALGKSAGTTFWWHVYKPVGKEIKGYGGKCLADYNGIMAPGNKIDIWNCTGSAAQKWRYTTKGALIVLGSCASALTGTSGTPIMFIPCIGNRHQLWTHRRNGEYALKAGGLCLTDPGWSKKNGTQMILRPCKDTSNQRWSLP